MPVIDPHVPILIGERSQSRPTDARLVTAIVHPNVEISKPYLAGTKDDAGNSRMVDFAVTGGAGPPMELHIIGGARPRLLGVIRVAGGD